MEYVWYSAVQLRFNEKSAEWEIETFNGSSVDGISKWDGSYGSFDTGFRVIMSAISNSSLLHKTELVSTLKASDNHFIFFVKTPQ